jgi:hypothetical protein
MVSLQAAKLVVRIVSAAVETMEMEPFGQVNASTLRLERVPWMTTEPEGLPCLKVSHSLSERISF